MTLLGYMSLVYSFLGDVFIFSDIPQTREIIGVLLIFGMNVTFIAQKLNADSIPESKTE